MRVTVLCADKYEAQKLASLVFIRDAGETYITGILNVVGNELVMSLKDKSAHSILFKDVRGAEEFADFAQSVIDGEDVLAGTEVDGEAVRVEKRAAGRPGGAQAQLRGPPDRSL